MKARVYDDPETGAYVEFDMQFTFFVYSVDGELVTTFMHGVPKKMPRARKIAKRWMQREFPKLGTQLARGA